MLISLSCCKKKHISSWLKCKNFNGLLGFLFFFFTPNLSKLEIMNREAFVWVWTVCMWLFARVGEIFRNHLRACDFSQDRAPFFDSVMDCMHVTGVTFQSISGWSACDLTSAAVCNLSVDCVCFWQVHQGKFCNPSADYVFSPSVDCT